MLKSPFLELTISLLAGLLAGLLLVIVVAFVEDALEVVEDLSEDAAVAVVLPGPDGAGGLPQHDHAGDLSVDLGAHGQQLLADVLQLVSGGGVLLDQAQEHRHHLRRIINK